MQYVLNLTPHVATAEHRMAGIVEPTSAEKTAIRKLCNFTSVPTNTEVSLRVKGLVELVTEIKVRRPLTEGEKSSQHISCHDDATALHVLIGPGIPSCMVAGLEKALIEAHRLPCYALCINGVMSIYVSDF